MNKIKQSLYSLFHHLPPGAKKVVRALVAPMYHARLWWRHFLGWIGYYRYPHRILFVAGLPKSGTTWVENFLYHLPGYSPRYLRGVTEAVSRDDLAQDAFADFPKRAYSFVKSHLNPSENNLEILKRNGVDRVVVMYRDLRDVTVSRYYHLLESPKLSNEPSSVNYASLDRENGMRHAIEIVMERFVPWVKGWNDLIKRHTECKFLVIRYEQLRTNPKAEFRRLVDFYGLPMSDDEIEKLMEKTKQGSKRGFSPRGLVGKKTTFRKGNIGDWRSEFSDAHKALFRERAGDFLVELGYEKDKNW